MNLYFVTIAGLKKYFRMKTWEVPVMEMIVIQMPIQGFRSISDQQSLFGWYITLVLIINLLNLFKMPKYSKYYFGVYIDYIDKKRPRVAQLADCVDDLSCEMLADLGRSEERRVGKECRSR